MTHAFTAIIGDKTFGVGRADEGTKGYTPCPRYGSFPTWNEATTMADRLNEIQGIDKLAAFKIVAKTMQ